MGILEAYSPTQGPDFLELRVLTDSAKPVFSSIREIERESVPRVVQLSPGTIEHDGCTFFWRVTVSSLPSGTAFHFDIWQEGCDGQLCVETSTLIPPSGLRLARFAVLADMHLNHATDPGKRLREHASDLASKALSRISDELGCEFVVMPGDLVDTTSKEDLAAARTIVSQAKVPCLPVTGNHDDPLALQDTFGLPDGGYYSFDHAGVHFVMISCPSELALAPGSGQFTWLEQDLEAHSHSTDTIIFSHYSFVAHPFYSTAVTLQDNGRQYLVYGKEVCELLKRFPRVRAVFAGHNNVPTVVESSGIAHLLCAQLIQGPCGYDIVDIYEGGFIRMVYEIEEQHLIKKAKDRAGGLRWSERLRPDCERNVAILYQQQETPPPSLSNAARVY